MSTEAMPNWTDVRFKVIAGNFGFAILMLAFMVAILILIGDELVTYLAFVALLVAPAVMNLRGRHVRGATLHQCTRTRHSYFMLLFGAFQLGLGIYAMWLEEHSGLSALRWTAQTSCGLIFILSFGSRTSIHENGIWMQGSLFP